MDVSFIEDKSLFDKNFLVSFIEDKSSFDKNSLQEENDVMEEIFWDLSLAPLPNTILTTPSLIYNPEEQCDKTNNLEDQCDKSDKNSSHIVPNITVFETGENQYNQILSVWFILGERLIKRVKVNIFLLVMTNLDLWEWKLF